MLFTNPQTHLSSQSGFTITELLISIGILVLISGVVLTRFGTFNSASLLKSEAYEIALAVRQAQLFAVSSQGSQADFSRQYGVHFDLLTPQQVLIYRDEDDNGRYEDGADYIVEEVTVDDRFTIRGFVDADDGGSDVTGGDGQLSISFLRPNFDAQFYRDSDTRLGIGNVFVELSVSGDDGNGDRSLRTIEVTAAGQITVN